MKRFIFCCFVFPFLLMSCSGTKNGSTVITKPKDKTGVNFVNSTSLTKVLEDAQKEGKIVFVDMYTTWCAPCKVMDEEVFTDPAVEDLLDNKMISYKVDAEKGNGPDLALIYNVQVYPTLLFLDNRGREILRNDGALSTTGFLELARQALDQHGL